MENNNHFPEWVKIGIVQQILGMGYLKAVKYLYEHDIPHRKIGEQTEYSYYELIKTLPNGK